MTKEIDDEAAIRTAINDYVEGVRTGDVEILKRAFHAQAIMCGYLGDSFGSGGVLIAGHDAFRPDGSNSGRHGFVVSRNDDGISDVHLRDSLPDPDDQGESGKEAEGLSGEAHSAEARWNDH